MNDSRSDAYENARERLVSMVRSLFRLVQDKCGIVDIIGTMRMYAFLEIDS